MAGRFPISSWAWSLLLGLTVVRAAAAPLELGIQTSPAIITPSRELTYALSLTNLSGRLLTNIVVNSTFNAAVTLISTTNRSGTAALEGSAVVFRIPQLPNTSNAVMGLVVQPLSAGPLTNNFQMLALNINEVTNTVNRVFAAEADLGLGLTAETNTLVTGDWTEFRLTVTNAGPETAPQILVTNHLPAGAQFLSITPSNAPVALTETQLVFAAGALALGSNVTFRVRVQANEAGTNLVRAEVGGNAISDPVPANNSTNRFMILTDPQPEILSAAFVSGQTLNPQSGLMEQSLRLSNPGPAAVAGGRVVFPALAQQLFNAAGTNNGQPFVTLTRSLETGESADLRIEYFVPDRVAFPNPTIEALAVPAYVPRPANGDVINGLRVVRLEGGELLIEFPAEPGQVYEIVYADEVTLSDPLRALPSVTATGTRVQWMEAGPPKTSRRPDEISARFYQVIKVE